MIQTLTAYDIFYKPHTALISDFKTRISAYGILIENNKILLQYNPVSKFYSLPGGSIEINESEQDTVTREFLEETGYSVTAKNIFDTDFRLFFLNNNFYHNLRLYYFVSKNSNEIIPISLKEGDSSESKFFDLKTINLDVVQPTFHKILNKLCH